jgi:lipoyl(octanoyl) transferase
MSGFLKVQWLGRISYDQGFQVQAELLERKAMDPGVEDKLFLLEHEPVYTTGRSVSADDEELRNLPYPVLQINRGGKATYHGPGQLVGYAVLDLRTREQDLHRHLRLLESGLIELALKFGVDAGTREGLTGVWCGERKLASIGVGVRRWITMHGFAINVCGALDGFNYITPCGLQGVEITSLEREGCPGADVASVAEVAAGIFGRLL